MTVKIVLNGSPPLEGYHHNQFSTFLLQSSTTGSWLNISQSPGVSGVMSWPVLMCPHQGWYRMLSHWLPLTHERIWSIFPDQRRLTDFPGLGFVFVWMSNHCFYPTKLSILLTKSIIILSLTHSSSSRSPPINVLPGFQELRGQCRDGFQAWQDHYGNV